MFKIVTLTNLTVLAADPYYNIMTMDAINAMDGGGIRGIITFSLQSV